MASNKKPNADFRSRWRASVKAPYFERDESLADLTSAVPYRDRAGVRFARPARPTRPTSKVGSRPAFAVSGLARQR